MARKKKGVNQSQQIRDYVVKHPTAKAADIAKELGVTLSLVYGVKSKMPKQGAAGDKPRRGRPPKAKLAVTPKSSSSTNGLDAIRTAAELVKRCGGIDEARKALDTVEAVTRVVS